MGKNGPKIGLRTWILSKIGALRPNLGSKPSKTALKWEFSKAERKIDPYRIFEKVNFLLGRLVNTILFLKMCKIWRWVQISRFNFDQNSKIPQNSLFYARISCELDFSVKMAGRKFGPSRQNLDWNTLLLIKKLRPTCWQNEKVSTGVPWVRISTNYMLDF